MDVVRAKEPGIIWTLSFSSLSGPRYVGEEATGFEIVTPLPLDYRTQLRDYLERIQPDLLIFIRYDLWPVFVEVAAERGVKMLLACATKRVLPSFPIFRALLLRTFRHMNRVSTVDQLSAEWYREIPGVKSVSIDGDTRLDRVRQRVNNSDTTLLSAVRDWVDSRPVLVAGSTWQADEQLLVQILSRTGFCAVIAPHVVSEAKLSGLKELFPDAITLSELQQDQNNATRERTDVVIVDCYGVLAELYAVGDIAWVGGGFGEGVHSVAEPAAHGLPVITGPYIEASIDAVTLMEAGGLFSCAETATEQVLSLLRSGESIGRMSGRVAEWLEDRVSSSSRVAELVLNLLAPNDPDVELNTKDLEDDTDIAH